MTRRNNTIFLRILCFILLFSFAADDIKAQRTKKSNTENNGDDYSPTSLRDRIYVGTYINTPSLFGNNVGTQFSVGLQPFAGYKFNEYISSGIALKFDYLYQNFSQTPQQFTDFSSTVFTRAFFANAFIIQVEGGLYSDHRSLGAFDKERIYFPILLAGVGYSFGNSEIILAYDISGNFFRNGILPFEYKFGFVFDL